MRIVLEPSDSEFWNVGDVAMTHVAYTRVAALWPHAAIQVLAEPSDLLAVFCPRATPLLAPTRREGRLTRLLRRLRRTRVPDARPFAAAELAAIPGADLLVVCGMGGVTDAFRDYAFGLLDRIELALRSDVAVAMVGQGIGPLADPALRARAAAVLPRVGLIALREERASRPQLEELGVSPARVATTGDDAIELAYSLRAPSVGRGLGVNLRLAPYAAVDRARVAQLRPVLQRAARAYHTPLVPIATARSDAETSMQLVSGYDDVHGALGYLETPLAVIEQLKQCRAIVAGSYHAAVFALALGIPAVCVANSAYYRDKFLGLAALFEVGCEVVVLGGGDDAAALATALDRVWQASEALRPDLWAAAERQIALGQAAYRRIRDLVPDPAVRTLRA
jgi:polysaccharide pyruvyl transferase WcaK-like protein